MIRLNGCVSEGAGYMERSTNEYRTGCEFLGKRSCVSPAQAGSGCLS